MHLKIQPQDLWVIILIESKVALRVLEEFDMPIHLCLGSSHPNTLTSIKKIYSHPMAIKETQRYFRKYSHITFISSESTASAIAELKNMKDPHAAVISSQEALEQAFVIDDKREYRRRAK